MSTFYNIITTNPDSGTLETMYLEGEPLFNLCISRQEYPTKPSKEQIPKLTFIPRRVTIDSVLLYAQRGRAFCYLFSTSNQDGLITLRDKTTANFLATSVIIYDFDNMDTSMMDYIHSLPYKPSFAYTTYSNGNNGLFRFRLGFVLDKEVSSEGEFKALYHAIGCANGFVVETKENGGWDVRNVAQLYYGTSSTSSTYNGSIIYTQAVFDPFVIDKAVREKYVASCSKTNSTKYETSISAEFLQDFRNLPESALFSKYRDDFHSNYILSLSTPLIMDESEMFFRYPDPYYCVRHKRMGKYTLKWEIGEDRKTKLFVTARIMLFNLPSLTVENLLYNLALERRWYYENTDNKISDEVLITTAIRAFEWSGQLNPSKHGTFTLNKAFWAEQGLNANQAKMIVRRYLKAQEIEKYYNPSLTRKENLRVLKENGVRICARTLRRMVTRGDIKINSKTPHTDLSYCPGSYPIQLLYLISRNQRITLSEMAKATNVSVKTVKRRINKMRGTVIEREGNNRTGRWIILPPYCDIAELSMPGVQKPKKNEPSR